MPLTIPGTPTAFPATNASMSRFHRLMMVVLLSGTIAGVVLFAVQHMAVVPLIESAERYEKSGHDHAEREWTPDPGLERIGFTALTTVLTSIGFAAMLFGLLAFTGNEPDARRGALWGLGAFVCFHLAPALGLPPEPPGVPVADVQQRQLWWICTVVATAIGLWLIFDRKRSWLYRIAGMVCLAIPHIVGAPVASGEMVVPVELMRRFAIASLATTAVFWPLLGAVGGYLYGRVMTARPHLRANESTAGPPV